MHPSNHYYGQAHVLARWCGLDPTDPPRIDGIVQHGWNPLHGWGFEKPEPPTGFGAFVWSDAARRRAQAYGWRGVVPIGAPFAYLLAMSPEVEDEREGTLYYPFHGWENGAVIGDHTTLAREIAEVEEGPVTVCLYWLEHEDPAIRGVYEEAGFRVVCHGRRGKNRKGGDADFLSRQLAELRRHRRVASNRLSTAVFYGVAAGCAMRVYGDPMRYEASLPIVERLDHVRRLFPDLHAVDVDDDLARTVAAAELGLAHVTPPAELRTLFGWPAPEGLDERSAA